MAVSKQIADALKRDFGSNAVNIPVVKNDPILQKTNSKGMATSSTASQTTTTTADSLKAQLKSLPYEARKALYESSFQQGKGMMSTFTLPSLNDPELGQFSGLTFTEDEWQKGYAAKFLDTTISQPQGTLVDQQGKVLPREVDETFWMDAEKARESQARQNRKEDRYRAQNLDYLSRAINSRPQEDPFASMYQPFDWTNPGTYLNGIWNVGVEHARVLTSGANALQGAGIDAARSILGSLDSMIGGGSYFHEWKDWAEQTGDELAGYRLKRPDLNIYNTTAERGMLDPAWYANALGSTIPHVVGALGASIIGAAVTKNPAGGFAGRYAYSSALEGGSMYNQMIDDGKTIEEARQAAQIYGTIAGAIDSLIPGLIGGKVVTNGARELLKKMADRSLKSEIAKNVAKYSGIVLGEGVTESAQELASNVTKSFYYDNIDILAGLPEAFVGGLVGGAAFAGAEAIIPGKQQGSAVRTPVGNTSPLQPQSGAQDRPPEQANAPQQAQPAQSQVAQSFEEEINTLLEQAQPAQSQVAQSFEEEINTLLEQARAETATIGMAEAYLQQTNDPEVQAIIDSTQERLQELNATAKQVLDTYVRTNAEMIVQNDNVNIQVGRTPDGQFVGTGTVTIGDQSFSMPFDVLRSSESRSEAIVNTTAALQGWFTQVLQTEGITDPTATDAVFNTITSLLDQYGNPEQFVEQNMDAVLTAQDVFTADDFKATLSENQIEVNGDYDLDTFFRRANDVDAVRITAREAEKIVQDLAGDLGVGVRFVEQISTNPRALGRFVQQVYNGMPSVGDIEIRTQGDGAQDIRISTPLHEVGHAVFRNLLTRDQQQEVLDAVRVQYKREQLTDKQAEERLVEDLKKEAQKQSKRRSRYGRFLAKLIDMGERLIQWLGSDPTAKIKEFQDLVLSKKKPSERKKMMERVREERRAELASELSASVFEAFQLEEVAKYSKKATQYNSKEAFIEAVQDEKLAEVDQEAVQVVPKIAKGILDIDPLDIYVTGNTGLLEAQVQQSLFIMNADKDVAADMTALLDELVYVPTSTALEGDGVYNELVESGKIREANMHEDNIRQESLDQIRHIQEQIANVYNNYLAGIDRLFDEYALDAKLDIRGDGTLSVGGMRMPERSKLADLGGIWDTYHDAKTEEAFQEVEQKYIGVHTTYMNAIREAEKLGGLIMPSIAVLPASTPFDKFGDISVVFNKSVYDPKQGGRLFDRDAYTPTRIAPEYDFDSKSADKVHESVLKGLLPEYNIGNRVKHFFPSQGKYDTPEAFYYDVTRGDAPEIVLRYLQDKGVKVEIPYKGGADLSAYPDALVDYVREYGRFEHSEAFSRLPKSITDTAVLHWYKSKKDSEATVESLEEVRSAREEVYRLYFKNAYTQISETLQPEVDFYALRDTLRELVGGDEAFQGWLKDKYGGLWSDPYIMVGRTKKPYTSENIAIAMKKLGDKAAEGTSMFEMNLLRARSASTTRIKSLEQAKNTELSTEETLQRENFLKDQIEGMMWNDVIPYAYPNASPFTKATDYFKAIYDYYNGAQTADVLTRALKKHDFDPTPEQVADLVDLLDEYAAMPDEYLEAKAHGVIQHSEISAIVAPKENVAELKTLYPNTPVYVRGEVDIAQLARDGEIEAFQEIPTPEDADMGPKKIFDITPVESLPSVEKQRYIEVFKRLSEARRTMMQATQDSLVDALTDVTEKIETLWKYDQYLVLQYGLGVRSQEMQIVDDVTAEVQEQMMRWQLLNDENMYMTPRIPTAVKLQTARNLAKAWKDIVVASKYVGAQQLSNEMAQYDFASVIARIGRLKEFASTQLTDKQLASMDVFLQAQSDLDQYIITKEGDTNAEGDAMDVELAEVWQMAADGVDSRTGRARLRDIGRQEDMDLARMEKSITRLGKQQQKAQALRARFQRLRTKKIERAEYLAQTDADRKVKQRIHAQLMREKRTVTMTEEQMMRFKYRQQSIGAEQAAREAKEELRRQYRLAKKRQAIMSRILKIEKTLRQRIKNGSSIDVTYGKQILEVLDTFQKSAVSNQLRDAYIKLLEMKKQGMFDRMEDAEGNPITEEQRDIAIQAIERIEKRLQQQALSQMTVEQMEALYDGIAQLVEEGRVMLQLKTFLQEQELEKEIEQVASGTVNLDGNVEMGTTAASMTKGAKQVDRKRMYLSVLAPSAVADRADGDQQYSGQNARIQREISAAGAAYTKEEATILVDAFTRIKEEIGLNEFTEMESAFVTLVARAREGVPGKFAYDQIVKHVFKNVIPGDQVGRVTRGQAEHIVDILQDTTAKYNLSERFIGTYEAITNTIFPRMENYVMMSKFVNAPNAWETASEDGVDTLQGHMMNSKNANIGSSNARQATNEMLIPRTDFLRLYADTVAQQAYYIHMQPVLNNASKIVNSRTYQAKAGQALSKWWQEYLSVVAKRGQWSGAANNRWLDKVKNNVTVAILAFKPSTMIMQLTQVSTAVMGTFAKYGPKAAFNVMQETVRMVAQRKYRNQVIQESNALSARAGTAGQYGVADLQKAITLQEFEQKNIVTIARDAATKYGMYLMQDLDITFSSANAEGIRKALLDAGLSEEDARTESDAMMGVMQSSTLVSDRPLFIAQGGSITKFLTALQTFSLGYYSMFTQLLVRGGVVKGDTRAKARALAAIAIIPVANALVGSLAREASALLRGDDQEDEFNLLNAVFFEQMRVIPIIGPMAQAALEYNKRGGLDNPAFGAMTKVLTGTMKALTESDDKQLDGIIDALSGVSMFAGIPGTATLGDVAKSFTYSEQQQVDRTLKQQVAGRDWKSLTQRDVDRIVSEVSMKKYGTLDITSAQKAAMEKTIYKAAMKQDPNDLVKMFATKSKNADKALILLEMSEQMGSTEFQSIITKLRSTKMLSEEGYMEFMKIKRGR